VAQARSEILTTVSFSVYTVCVSVRGLQKAYVCGLSICSWTTRDGSGVIYSYHTMPFVVKCCPVIKQWNCCCHCELRTAALCVGWTCMVCFPLLLFFPHNVLLYHGENVISYFRHGLIQYFTNSFVMEILLSENSIPGLIELSVLKFKCSKICFYYLTT